MRRKLFGTIAAATIALIFHAAPVAAIHDDLGEWDDIVPARSNPFHCTSFRIYVNTEQRLVAPLIGSCAWLRDSQLETAKLLIERIGGAAPLRVLKAAGIGSGAVVFSANDVHLANSYGYLKLWACGNYQVTLIGRPLWDNSNELTRMSSRPIVFPCGDEDEATSGENLSVPAPTSIAVSKLGSGRLRVRWYGGAGSYLVVATRRTAATTATSLSRRTCIAHATSSGSHSCVLKGVSRGTWTVSVERTVGWRSAVKKIKVTLR